VSKWRTSRLALPRARELRKGDLLLQRRSEGSEALHVVIEVSDTGVPRYGSHKGTRKSYRVVNPSTGAELNLSEFEIAAEYAVKDHLTKT
jgi:hypothetical protein